jgi:NADPH2:quinone reductase
VEIDPGAIMGAEAEIYGVMARATTEKERKGIHAALGAGLENGTLRPVVGQELPLADAPGAQPPHHGSGSPQQDRAGPVNS